MVKIKSMKEKATSNNTNTAYNTTREKSKIKRFYGVRVLLYMHEHIYIYICGVSAMNFSFAVFFFLLKLCVSVIL